MSERSTRCVGAAPLLVAQNSSDQHQEVGAVPGGRAGQGIGGLIGGSTCRDVAMVAGAVGGAPIGNDVHRKHDRPVATQQIIVRTNPGVLVAVAQPVGPNLCSGQKAYIQGNGENATVTPE